MSSAWTLSKIGSNPRAEAYGAAAKAIATATGTKHFYYFPPHEDRNAWPSHKASTGCKGVVDNPFKEMFGFIRWRWVLHDFRVFGLRKALRKHYYVGEQWRMKDEKIFCGEDENGNKYWMSRRSRGSNQGRFVEPADPHWFRGQCLQTPNAAWSKWLVWNSAHSPVQIKARGEYGLNSRNGIPLPFSIRHSWSGPQQQGTQFMRDPAHIWPTHLVSPHYRVMKEAGFSKWGVVNKGFPVHAPFHGVHDFPEEVEEEYYRVHSAFSRANKGNDHDEWRA